MQNINSICLRLLLLLAVFNLPLTNSAQVTFEKTYPTTYDKTSRDVLPTSDGGYILVGMTNNSNITDCDLLIMKTDAMGNQLWAKTYGGAKPDYAYGMVETTDGNYFVTGYSQSFGGGDYDIYLIKFDPNGDKIFEKTFGSWGNEEAREIIKTSDGNYVIVGTSNSFSSTQDMVLIKIDNSGTAIWTKTYGGSDKEYGNSVKQCSDGGYIIGGQTFTWGQNGDTYVVRTNATGDTLWTKYYGSPLSDEAGSILSNSDGGFTFAIRDSTASNDIDVRVINVNSTGTVNWNKNYGASLKDTPKTLCATSDGGYLVGAISRSFGWINPDMWLLKMNSAGDTTWSRHFGSSDHEHCHMAKQMTDGSYLAAGHARSWGPGQKVYFLKLNSSGVVSVNEQFASTTEVNIYPNPSLNSSVYFRLRDNQNSNVTICNSLGQRIYSGTIGNGEMVDLSRHSAGIYLVTLETGKEKVVRKLVLGE
ncbi:MAG: lipoprotein [Bacteroidetes bacterium]|nr:lipoprotein [Bacteroidota bacterium]